MDNNLINIDDLVRQRLTGAEEREPSGAWANMRELLDKEKDRKPVGFFWRRRFGALALLVLVASVSLGGYELSAYRAGQAATGVAPIAAVTGLNNVHHSAAPAVNEDKLPVTTENNAGQKSSDFNHTAADNTAGDHVVAATNVNSNSTNHKQTNKSIYVQPVADNSNGMATSSPNRQPRAHASKSDIPVRSSDYAVTNHSRANPLHSGNGATATGNISNLNSDGSSGASHVPGSKLPDNNNLPVASQPRNARGADNTTTGKTAHARSHHTTGANITAPAITKATAAGGANKPLSIGAAISGSGNMHTISIKHSNTDVTTGDNAEGATGTDGDAVAAGINSDVKATHINSTASNLKSGTHRNKHTVTGDNTVGNNKVAVVNSKLTAGSAHTGIAATPESKTAVNDNTAIAIGKHNTRKQDSNPVAANGGTGADKMAGIKNKSGITSRTSATGVHAIAATDVVTRGNRISGYEGGMRKAKKAINTASMPLGSATSMPVANTGGNAKMHDLTIGNSRIGKSKISSKSVSGSHIAGAKGTNGIAGSKAIAANTPALKKTNKPSGGSKAVTAPQQGTNILSSGASYTASASPKKGAKPGGGSGNTPAAGSSVATSAPTASVARRMGMRSIEKVTISERYTQASPTTYLLHLDTISIESVNQEFALAGENTTDAASKRAGDDGAAASNAGDVALKPGAAAAETDKPAEGKNENERMSKKGKGHGLETIESAFNDIKYKIKGAQFAMGLTGGINGTFFGPNGFKGFQFGVTSNFIFSESVNIMAELKYFHRINNDYTLNGNYSTYTPNGNGGYSQTQMLNPYSLSTLHSFELPFIVRYTKGKINFFAGGNFVYSMAINESQGIAAPGVTSLYAGATPGADTASKIKTSDFNARFGIGYLFGVSVQLSPELSLDLRDVQTVWDNSKTDGAKEVSSQLYKSPSFQLSLGYRFGGKKSKER